MPSTSYRVSRVESLLMREIARLILQEVDDPRLCVKEITITQVKISPDLRHAKVFFTLLDDKKAKKVAHLLNHSVPFLRRRVGEALILRVVPELFFIFDKSLRQTQHLLDLIERLNPDEKKS